MLDWLSNPDTFNIGTSDVWIDSTYTKRITTVIEMATRLIFWSLFNISINSGTNDSLYYCGLMLVCNTSGLIISSIIWHKITDDINRYQVSFEITTDNREKAISSG